MCTHAHGVLMLRNHPQITFPPYSLSQASQSNPGKMCIFPSMTVIISIQRNNGKDPLPIFGSGPPLSLKLFEVKLPLRSQFPTQDSSRFCLNLSSLCWDPETLTVPTLLKPWVPRKSLSILGTHNTSKLEYYSSGGYFARRWSH